MSVVTDLEKGLVKLNNTSYNSVDKLMKKVAKDNDISTTELHHKFKAKHNMIPDDWIKTQMQEGNLHKWFKGSKSKDGKSGFEDEKYPIYQQVWTETVSELNL